MINAYKQGKDLYATIAMGVYHNKYEENLEFNPITQQISAEGAARRSSVKSLLLGIMYGRGVASIAEQIHGTVEEAQNIIDNFYKSFPQVKTWMDESEESCKKNGYVEDLWGRRRRLPDILLPKFTIRYKDKNVSGDFNPFIGCSDRVTKDKTLEKYRLACEQAKSKKQLEDLKLKALNDGIEIINNGGFISTAQRQCVNARIQGSAASMTKKAMIKIFRDKELRDLGFKLEIGVHDELIGECPLENIDRVAELLTYDMRTCAEDTVTVPFKCDPDISFNWYFNSYCASVNKEYNSMLKGDKDKGIEPLNEKDAFDKLKELHSELTIENLYEVVNRDFQNQSEDDWKEYMESIEL